MPFDQWPQPIGWLATALAALLVFDAARRADWPAPMRERTIWIVATGGVLLARQMTVTMPGGLSLQYLGAAWLGLLLGYPRAVVSMAIVYTIEALAGRGNPGLALLLHGIAPAWLIWLFASASRRYLPPNLFVFLLGPGFLGLFVCHVVPLLLAAWLWRASLAADAPSAKED